MSQWDEAKGTARDAAPARNVASILPLADIGPAKRSQPTSPPDPDEAARRAWQDVDQCLRDQSILSAKVQGMLEVLSRVAENAGENASAGSQVAGLLRDLGTHTERLAEQRRSLARTLDECREGARATAQERERYSERALALSEQLRAANRTLADKTRELGSNKNQLQQIRTTVARLRDNLQHAHRSLRRLEQDGAKARARGSALNPLSRWAAALSSARAQLQAPLAHADPPEQQPPRAPFPALPLPRRITGAERDDLAAVLRRPIQTPVGRWHAGVAPEALPVVALVVWGLDAQAVRTVVDRFLADAGERPWCAPLFVTDAKDFAPLRREAYAFEYLPGADARATQGDDLDWPLYYARRAAGIRNKWAPSSVLLLGERPPFAPELLCVS